ncbi:uncharacterized protein LOC126746576 [Anthonomus grandis grandis]|uniref:uncharacterized protein LOC126746576 n=1 Tax=Anthonomus grandis grandis TaxID=2921223 RepID=UPI0021659F15|nr:uncharacterized protein LOC126746576 [Anthonomus grandis grandis]
MKNWHDIKHQWSMHTEFCKNNFLNNTNNRLESINGKIKDVISRNSSLEDFFIGFFKITSSMNSERAHKFIYSELKRTVTKFEADSVEARYLKLLTKEPGKQLIKQLEFSRKVKDIQQDLALHNSFLIKSSEGTINTDIYKCSCSYFISMLLPCRHIFAVRKLLNQPLFDPLLPDKRWTVSYNKSVLFPESMPDENETENIFPNVAITIAKPKHIVSYGQKRRNILPITNSLADLAAQRSNMLYERRKQLLLTIKKYWEEDIDIKILPVSAIDSLNGDKESQLVSADTSPDDISNNNNWNLETEHLENNVWVPAENVIVEELVENNDEIENLDASSSNKIVILENIVLPSTSQILNNENTKNMVSK